MGMNKKMKQKQNSTKKANGMRTGKRRRKPILAVLLLICFSTIIVLDLANLRYGASLTQNSRRMSTDSFPDRDGQAPQMSADGENAQGQAPQMSADGESADGEAVQRQAPQMGADGQRPQRPGEESSTATGIFANEQVRKFMSTCQMYWIAILCVATALDLLVIFYLIDRHGKVKKEMAEEARLRALREENDDEDYDSDDFDDDDDDGYVKRSPVRAAALPLCLVLTVSTIIYQLPTVQPAGNLMVVEAEVVNAQAEAGTVTSTLTGSGSLSGESTVNLSIPAGVTVDTYYVANGDIVQAGDLLASVNTTSVEEEIVTLQAAMDDLDVDLEADDEADQTITATANGTVKAVFAQAGDMVTDVMEEYGALMLISLDGLMEIDVNAQEELSIGSKVIVTLSDGTEETGRVAQIEEGIARITLSDDNAAYQETVTVTDQDGNDLGSGMLSIYNCLKVTGYYGEVYSVDVAVDEAVETGDQLLDITDANTAAESTLLLDTRTKLEVKMAELCELREDPCIYAQLGGVVSGVPEDAESSGNTLETSAVVAEEAVKTGAEDTAVQAAAEVAVPETPAPETAAPETAAPETAAPETAAPETAAPETAAPETAAPETTAPETTAPETAAPETAAATETTATEMAATETTASKTEAAQTTPCETAVTEKAESDAQSSGTQNSETSASQAQNSKTSTTTEQSTTTKSTAAQSATTKSTTAQTEKTTSSDSQTSKTTSTDTQAEKSNSDEEKTTESQTEETGGSDTQAQAEDTVQAQGTDSSESEDTQNEKKDEKESDEESSNDPEDGSYYGYIVSMDTGTNKITIRYAKKKSNVSANSGTEYEIQLQSLDNLSKGAIISFTVSTKDGVVTISDLTVLLANGIYAARVNSVSGGTVNVSYAAHTSDAKDAETLNSEVGESAGTYTFTTSDDVSGLKEGSMILLTVTDAGITFKMVSDQEEESTEQTDEESTEQTDEESTEQTDEESTEQTDEESTEQTDEESTEQTEEESTEQTDEESTESSGGSGSGKSGQKSADGDSSEETEKSDSEESESEKGSSSRKDSSNSPSNKGSNGKSSSESESSGKNQKSSGSGSAPSGTSAKGSTASAGSASGGSAAGGSASGGQAATGTSAEAAVAEGQSLASYDLYDLTEEDILTVSPQETMSITIEADELDVLALKEGQSASVTLDALEGRSFTGIVTNVNMTGTNGGGNTKYTATITLDKTDEMLEGMNASVRIETESVDTAVTVPAEALVEENGKTYVYTSYDEKTDTLGSLQEVETGVSDGINVEITKGLTKGQDYYYRYAENVNYTFS